jgi:hypothetical protein
LRELLDQSAYEKSVLVECRLYVHLEGDRSPNESAGALVAVIVNESELGAFSAATHCPARVLAQRRAGG